MIIDSCAYPRWPGTARLSEYVDEAWREILLRPGDRAGPPSVLSPRMYVDPRQASKREALAVADEELAGRTDADRIVLGWDDGLFSTVFPYPHVARTVVHAANEWLQDEWLQPGSRFYGMILISSVLPDEAAAEVRVVGEHDRVVAVALGGNGLGQPFGERIYVPIFEAAADLGLPVVLQLGSDGAIDQSTPPIAGGLPSTYAEYESLSVHSHMSHVASMIISGLFERFPTLSVLLIGGGMTWIPSWLWRLDGWFKTGRRYQAPWLKRLPSEYFVDHIRVVAQPVELNHDQDRLERVWNALPSFDQVPVYATCFPHGGDMTAEAMAERLPSRWRGAFLSENATHLFRWPRELESNGAQDAMATRGG